MNASLLFFFFFFFNDTATTEIYTLSLHDALPILLTADPACRIAVLISVGVYGAIAVSACRITRSIRVQGAVLGVQWQSGYRQRQGCKNEARHRTPPLLSVRCNDARRL